MEHCCEECGKLFVQKQSLARHRLNVHIATKNFYCSKCEKTFSRNDNKLQHEKHCNGEQLSGSGLKRKFDRENKEYVKKLKSNYKIDVVKTAFKNVGITWKIKFDEGNFLDEIEEAVDAMTSTITNYRHEHQALKLNMSLHLVFEKATDSSVVTEPPVCLVTEQMELYKETNILELLDLIKKQLNNQVELYEQNGSGWILSHLVALDTTAWKLDPLRASTYHRLPQWIRRKGAVVNVRNEDKQCFKWSVLAGLHEPTSKTNKNLVSSYRKYEKEYDFSMKYPVAIKDITKFEKRNNISINVYGVEEDEKEQGYYDDDAELIRIANIFDSLLIKEGEKPVKKQEDGVIYPLKVCKQEITGRHVNLLLTEKNGIFHYSTITKFSRLIGSQYNRDHRTYFYCYSCLHGFRRKKNEKTREDCELLKEHQKYCKTLKPQRTVFPQDETLKFTNIQKQLKAPFVVYADFECALKKASDDDVKQEVFEGVKKKKEFSYQQHVPVSYCYKIVSIDPDFKHELKLYKGEDAAEHFLDSLQEETWKIYKKYIAQKKPLVLTDEEEIQFQEDTRCHICQQDFKEDDVKVRDHCHVLGIYRSAAHESCNLNYRILSNQYKMPIFLHNLRGYDGHIIIHAIQERHGKVRVIPTNMEKYMAFSVGQLQFLDSFQFTLESLDSLVKTLRDDEFVYTREEFTNEEEFKLIKQKGIFPYDYLDDFSKLASKEIIEYPSRETFFNKLNDKEVSEKDYLHGKLVWNKFGCKTFEDYHDIYLKTDVLLLTDFFEKFRETCLSNYQLDPTHYFTTPGLAWDAALKMTEVELELLQNEEMYTFFERGIRGGVSMISKRYSRANNPGCADYDSTKPTTYLIDLDMNNLYGGAMTLPLPTDGFQWLTPEEIEESTFESISDDSDVGFVLEVDLEYPSALHNLHNSYPLAPEALEIDETMFSPLQKTFPSQPPQIKLTPNLRDKVKYIVHYRNLKFYLKMGMRVKKIHRVLQFNQRPWLKKYIDYNTSCRARSKSKFEKDFYKLMNNSVFGKTQENLRNRVSVEIITDPEKAAKRIAKPSFKRSQIIREDLVVIQNNITTLKLCKPLYIGFAVLDLSKLLMFEFHYEEMLPAYEKIELCFTDTDSLLYEIQTEDIYEDMLANSDWYDFSEYPFEHLNYDPKNKKIIGKMKDELQSMIIIEFIGLRPKCYSIQSIGSVKDNVIQDMDLHYSCTAKGVKKDVKKEHLRHEHYKDSLFNLRSISVKQNIIKSKKHEIGTYHITKVALSAFDTKRWIEADNIHTLAHGHYKTQNLSS